MERHERNWRAISKENKIRMEEKRKEIGLVIDSTIFIDYLRDLNLTSKLIAIKSIRISS